MATKMRDYVDAVQGPGAWDRMHELINQMAVPGWRLPEVEVDGRHFAIFPGTDPEATVEDVQNEIRRALHQIEAGDFEIVP